MGCYNMRNSSKWQSVAKTLYGSEIIYLWETYSKPCETDEMELFTKTIKSFQLLTIFAESTILDIWQDSEYASVSSTTIRQ